MNPSTRLASIFGGLLPPLSLVALVALTLHFRWSSSSLEDGDGDCFSFGYNWSLSGLFSLFFCLRFSFRRKASSSISLLPSVAFPAPSVAAAAAAAAACLAAEQAAACLMAD